MKPSILVIAALYMTLVLSTQAIGIGGETICNDLPQDQYAVFIKYVFPNNSIRELSGLPPAGRRFVLKEGGVEDSIRLYRPKSIRWGKRDFLIGFIQYEDDLKFTPRIFDESVEVKPAVTRSFVAMVEIRGAKTTSTRFGLNCNRIFVMPSEIRMEHSIAFKESPVVSLVFKYALPAGRTWEYRADSIRIILASATQLPTTHERIESYYFDHRAGLAAMRFLNASKTAFIQQKKGEWVFRHEDYREGVMKIYSFSDKSMSFIREISEPLGKSPECTLAVDL